MNSLYFVETQIYKLQNINNSSTIAIVPVTQNVGCVDGKTIQEFAGDLIFLAPDGFRTIAGTARIGDVELGTVSKPILPLINDILTSSTNFEYSSVVLRDKSQYRMYYSGTGESTANSKGITGTLTARGFEWTEVKGIQAPAVTSGFNSDGREKVYHGDRAGYVL